MPRLTEKERQTLFADQNGHYSELLLTHPDWEFAPGLGLPQLRLQEEAYGLKQADIVRI